VTACSSSHVNYERGRCVVARIPSLCSRGASGEPGWVGAIYPTDCERR
jgi:hypothetical protein